MPVLSSLTPTPKASTIVLLSGLTYVPAAILTPIVTNYQLKKSGVTTEQRKLLVKNETVRQAVSAGIHFLTYYGGVLLAGRIFKNKAAQKPLMELLTGVLFSTIGHGVIRPMLTNGLLVQWLKKEQELPLENSGFSKFVSQVNTRRSSEPVFSTSA